MPGVRLLLNGMRRKTYYILLILFVLLGCNRGDGRIKLVEDAGLVKKEVLNEVPVGSSIDDAKMVMEGEGFVCEMVLNKFFIESVDSKGPVVHEGIDYLYCDKRMSAGWFVSRRWQIAIVQRDGVVADALVSTNLTSL